VVGRLGERDESTVTESITPPEATFLSRNLIKNAIRSITSKYQNPRHKRIGMTINPELYIYIYVIWPKQKRPLTKMDYK